MTNGECICTIMADMTDGWCHLVMKTFQIKVCLSKMYIDNPPFILFIELLNVQVFIFWYLSNFLNIDKF